MSYRSFCLALTGLSIWAVPVLADPIARFAFHDAVRALAFSPDGQSLAAGGDDRFVKIWDLKTRTKRTFMSHANVVDKLTFCCCGKRLACLGHQPIIQRRRIDQPKSTTSMMVGYTSVLDRFEVAINRTWDSDPLYFYGSPLVTVVLGERLITATREVIDCIPWSGRKSTFHPKYQRLLAVNGKSPDECWFVGTRSIGKPTRLLAGPIPFPVEDLAYRLDHWKVGAKEPTATYPVNVVDRPYLTIKPGESPLLVAIDAKSLVQLGRIIDGTVVWQSLAKTATVLAISPDGKLLATGGNDKSVTLWSLLEAKELQSFARTEPITALCFSPDGQRLASGDQKGNVQLQSLLPD